MAAGAEGENSLGCSGPGRILNFFFLEKPDWVHARLFLFSPCLEHFFKIIYSVPLIGSLFSFSPRPKYSILLNSVKIRNHGILLVYQEKFNC
jgi:hypothetical protein